jgi:hypothetical protein
MGASGGDGTATIWWRANTEADLSGYHVYIREDGQFARINDQPVCSNHMAIRSHEGAVQLYVTAVDFSGNESGPSVTKTVQTTQRDLRDRTEGTAPLPKGSF